MVAGDAAEAAGEISLIWRCSSLLSEVRNRCTAVCTASSADPIRTRPTASTLTGTPLLDNAFCRLIFTLNGSSDMTSTRSMPGIGSGLRPGPPWARRGR